MLKKYMIFIAILTGISIVLGMSYSNFIVASENHKVAEMYIGTLKYSMTIDGTTKNTLSVPTGETIVDVTITNENPIDTYYKLIYQNNSNVSIKYYESTKDTNDNVTNYSSPNSKITSNNKNTIKLKIVNNSTSSQTVTFKIVGGFATNTLNDVTVPSGYTIINTVETPSTNTYFCTTTGTLTQGLKYVNGQYTYAYKQQGGYASSGISWYNMSKNGWGVQLTDKTSTDAVTSSLCTYINNKPISSMSNMFLYSQATSIDLSNFNTSKVTDMSNMFWNSQATTLDVSNFDTSNVTDMGRMFQDSQATSIDLSNFNTSKVTEMGSMFVNSNAITLDLSNFDTSNVTNMQSMFFYSKATILDLSSFDTSNVTDMGNMFYRSQATILDVSNFNTSKVTNMYDMFFYSKATILDLSSFDTSKVTDMDEMFADAQNLKTIYISDKFNTDNVTTSTNMFNGCTNLVGGAGTKYNSSYVDKTYARIDGGTSNPGYFTDIADKDIPAPNSFATDSWKTIIKAVRNNNISKYSVGATKTIDMGTYGTHTIRIANKSTPNECSRAGFSQTACGFVLEFADIITTHKMNDTNTNVGGWPATSMRTFVNNDIYNAIPSEIKNAIIDTTVVSGHGSRDDDNFTSTDKLYLLSTAEVWADAVSSSNGINGIDEKFSILPLAVPEVDTCGVECDNARNVTRQLDYYKNLGTTPTNYSGAIKKNGTSADNWWLRAAKSTVTSSFYRVSSSGHYSQNIADTTNGVSPAFRIG